MAVAFRSLTAPDTVSVNLNLPYPAGVQPDDILILICETADEAVAAPSGWEVLLPSPLSRTGTNPTRLSLFWRRAGASEPSSVFIADPGSHVAAILMAVSGAETSGSPFNAAVSGIVAQATTIQMPSVTSVVDGCLILWMAANGSDTSSAPITTNANVTSSAGVTGVQRANYSSAVSDGGGFYAYTGEQGAAGPSGMLGVSNRSGGAVAAITLAIMPPQAVTPQPVASPFLAAEFYG